MISLLKFDSGIFHNNAKLFKSKSSWLGTITLLLFLIPMSAFLIVDIGKVDGINSFTEKYVGNERLLVPSDEVTH